MIYHILTASEWVIASRQPSYAPTRFAADGFIHCCRAEQLQYVAGLHFRGQHDLVILCIDVKTVAAPIEDEDLSGEGMLFPHIYGALNIDAVKKVIPFPSTTDGWQSISD